MTYTPSEYFEDNTGKSCLSTISRIFSLPPTLKKLKDMNVSVGFSKFHTVRLENTLEGYHAVYTYNINDLGFDATIDINKFVGMKREDKNKPKKSKK
jgi:hypothetical protein